MLIIWLVIAVLLYIPFKKWVATANAPFVAALLWPLYLSVLGLYILTMLFVQLFKKKN